MPNTIDNGGRLSRRQWLLKALQAAASILAVGGAGYAFSRRYVDWPQESTTPVTLPDFSVPGQAGKLAIATGTARSETVQAAIDAIGGMRTFVAPGDRVLVKVNAAFASGPMISATTHPDLVTAVTRLCLDAGAAEVLVADNPINDPVSCFNLTGIGPAASRAGATVVIPKDSDFKPAGIAGAKLLDGWPIFVEPFRRIDKLIGVAPLKDHHRSGASMTMKNWYGLLGGRRNVLHQDIHSTITELAMMVSPTLVILDGTTAMMRNGPTGGSLSDLKSTNTMIVSTDQVAADAYGATLLEKTVDELPFVRRAAAAGLGTADYESLKPTFV